MEVCWKGYDLEDVMVEAKGNAFILEAEFRGIVAGLGFELDEWACLLILS